MVPKRFGFACLLLSLCFGTLVWGQDEVTDPNDPNAVVLEHPAIVIVSNGSNPAADAANGKNIHADWVDVNTPWDQGWEDMLTAAGYNVYRNDGTWAGGLTPENKALLEAADLVIISRDTGKGAIGNYKDQWNPVPTPLICMNPWPIGTQNDVKFLSWFPGTDGGNGAPMMVLADKNSTVAFLDAAVGFGTTDFLSVPDAGNGTVLASVEEGYITPEGVDLGGSAWIVEWDAGAEFYADVNQFAGDTRIYMAAGTHPGDDLDGTFWGKGMYNLTAEGGQIFMDMVADIVSPPASTPDPVACLKFEGDVLDEMGNVLDPNLVGDVQFSEGVDGLAMGLDGISSYANLGADFGTNVMPSLTNFSISVWVKTARTETTGWPRILQFGNADNNQYVALLSHHSADGVGTAMGGPRFEIKLKGIDKPDDKGNNLTLNAPGEVMVDDEWVHIVSVLDADANWLGLYVDGVLAIESADYTRNPSHVPVYDENVLGTANIALNKNYFVGMMDEFKVFDQALSADEVSALVGE